MTLSIDSSSFPGGIGSEGGISSYCHGMPGGLQTEVDTLTNEISTLLTGTSMSLRQWHPLGKRLAILSYFEKSGVQLMGETILCGVERTDDGQILSALVANEGRILRIEARSFIDSTGDGDLCAFSGANFVQGRSGDSRCLSFTQSSVALKTTSEGCQIVIRNYDAGWCDPTNPEDLTRARLRGIAQYLLEKWTVDETPVALAPLLGLRQSRQIQTDVMVTLNDLIMGSRFPDSIGETLTFADTHSVDFEFESDQAIFYYWVCQSFRQELRCELPYRMMLPVGLKNVWIACRAAGCEGEAAYAVRMQRDIQRLGEAAGIAAALVSGFINANPGFELLGSARPSERRLRWTARNGFWHDDMIAVIRKLRAQLSAAPFLISHCSQQDFPVYSATTQLDPVMVPGNVRVLSPSLSARPVRSLEDRFAFGIWGSESLAKLEQFIEKPPQKIPATLPHACRTISCDVMVAGSGDLPRIR